MQFLPQQLSVLTLIGVALLPSLAHAQDNWKGRSAEIVTSSANLMKGSAVLDRLPRGRVVKVLAVREQWIGVVSGARRGWILKRDLRLVPQSSPESTSRITTPAPPAQSRLSLRQQAEQSLKQIEQELLPGMDEYRNSFSKAGQLLIDRRQNDSSQMENLRQQVSRLFQSGPITKERTRQIEPHLRRLAQRLTVDTATVLDSSPELAQRRKVLIDEASQWQEAMGRWVRLSSRPHSTLTKMPNAESLIRWHEELAVQLLLPISESSRETLLANRTVAGRLDPEEAFGIHAINELRILIGARPLRIDARLVAAARDHSNDMIRLKFFDHQSPVQGKSSPSDRARRFGTVAWGENIAWGSRDGEDTIDMWFHSPGHLTNMISRQYGRMGLGRKKTHWTLMFGQ